ncbi:MAG TPA: GrpB family protein [Acidobacteriaceae bacterium]|jgi:GrpB-like predicted nucleotidyltransferase (UPF0157 family)
MPPPIAVELLPYSPDWARTAEMERGRLENVLGANLIAVHHIGSTAIPGICAKPIVDLMPEVQSLIQLDEARQQVCSLGYQWWAEYGMSGRRYCTLDEPSTGKRHVQLHCFERGNVHLERHLAFRDYLCAHPEIAREYETRKIKARALHPNDSHAYTDAKSAWITPTQIKALAWFRSQGG